MTRNAHPLKVLRIDASMRQEGSVSRELADDLVAALEQGAGPLGLVTRDLADGVPLVDDEWIDGNFNDPEDRTDAHRKALAVSDALVDELRSADVLVLAVPIYNFSIPAALKAWIDQIARARETFRFTEDGPVGLLTGKKAYVVAVSAGTEIDSEIDFGTPYLRHLLGFIGIHDVTVIGADGLMFDAEGPVAAARAEIAKIAADARIAA